ncbi:MAG: hypothetical protein U1E65_02030 [Myxococcota bacterium]
MGSSKLVSSSLLCLCCCAAPVGSLEPLGPSPTPSPSPTPTVETNSARLCAQRADAAEVVMSIVSGPYGGKQDLMVVHADGTRSFIRSFGPERSGEADEIYIMNAEASVEQGFLVVERAQDGAVILDRDGEVVLDTMDATDVDLFFDAHGTPRSREPAVKVSDEVEPQLRFRDGTVMALPDYHGEPNPQIWAVRGDFAMIFSYVPNRVWRVNLRSHEVLSIRPRAPEGLQPFSPFASDRERVLLNLDDRGEFWASLRDRYAAAVYHSPDGTSGWTRVGAAAQRVDGVYSVSQAGTYFVSASPHGSTPEQTWETPPADYGPVMQGGFAAIERPEQGLHYAIESDALLDDRGECAVINAAPGEDVYTLRVLEIESGRISPLPLPKNSAVSWISFASAPAR